MAGSSTFVSADADGYELQMGRWSRLLAPLLVDFAGITGADHVLDVGCGTGSLSRALAENGAIQNVRGVDLAPVYVESARRQNDDMRLRFDVADACSLPFLPASFDHTLSMLVLPFIPQADLAVREMRRVTRPGGTVAAATWDTRGGLVYYRMIFDTAAALDQRANERRAQACTRPMSRPGDLARAWNEAGLRNVAQDTRSIRMDFISFADFWAPCDGRDGPVADFFGTLDEQAKAKLRNAIEQAYLDGEQDGSRSFAATAWVVKGRVPG